MTRRELLAAGTMSALAFDAMLAPTAAPAATTDDDGSVLRSVLEVELLAVYVYEQVLASASASAPLTPAARQTLTRLLTHERAHVPAVTAQLTTLGAEPPPPPSTTTEADEQLRARHSSLTLTGTRTQDDRIRLLLDLEQICEGAYYEALLKLSAPRPVRLAAEILASEAQHFAALSELLHPGDLGRAVPDAFVEGTH